MAPTPSSSPVARETIAETGNVSAGRLDFGEMFLWAGRLAIFVAGCYGISDFLINFKQRRVDERAEERERVQEVGRRLRVRQKAWGQFARREPEKFLERVVLRKEAGSSERRASVTFLYVANPEWVKENRARLKDVESRPRIEEEIVEMADDIPVEIDI